MANVFPLDVIVSFYYYFFIILAFIYPCVKRSRLPKQPFSLEKHNFFIYFFRTNKQQQQQNTRVSWDFHSYGSIHKKKKRYSLNYITQSQGIWKINFKFFLPYFTSMLHFCDSCVWNVLNFITNKQLFYIPREI